MSFQIIANFITEDLFYAIAIVTTLTELANSKVRSRKNYVIALALRRI